MSLLPLDEARRLVLATVAPGGGCRVPLAEAHGRVAAAQVRAPAAVRPFASSAMDGVAVRAADTPGRLWLVGEARAGHPGPAVGPGEAVRISTGAPLPDGADAVVRQERTRAEADHVEVERVPAGVDVRPAGDDLAAGEVVVRPGDLLTAAHLGVLASCGVHDLVVHDRPRVGVLTTGDEVVPDGTGRLLPGDAAARGTIHDANRPMLLARVAALGATPVDLGGVGDDPEALAAALRDGAGRCEPLVTTGGASVGPHDHLAGVLARSGTARSLHLAVKPAKPFVLGEVAGVVVLGLPGNPLAAFVGFELLARPAVRRLAGWPVPVEPPQVAVAGDDLERDPDGRLHVLPVALDQLPDGRRRARFAERRRSHQIVGLLGADALGLVPDGHGLVAGDPLDVLGL